MGQTARERFHQQLQQGNEAATQGEHAEAPREQAPVVFASSALAKLHAARTARRQRALLKRCEALGLPTALSELPTDPDALDELERTVEELERGE
jgi:glycerol dehydrogenase-like iron-containing ADH family enzyme